MSNERRYESNDSRLMAKGSFTSKLDRSRWWWSRDEVVAEREREERVERKEGVGVGLVDELWSVCGVGW